MSIFIEKAKGSQYMERQAKQKLLTNNEISAFCGQMAMMLNAGISVTEALSVMKEDAVGGGQDILETLLHVCEDGNSFHSAVCQADVFPKYVQDMVSIGEQTGNLDTVMASLASYYEREEAISLSIKNAVTYPFLMIAMMLVVIFVLIVKVLPIFNQVYMQLGSEMSGISKSIMNMGTAVSRYAALFVLLFLLLAALYFFFSKTRRGKACMASVGSRFFLTKGLYESISAGRFASGMALALRSGFGTEQGLEMVAVLVNNAAYARKIENCRQYINDGLNFSEALIKAGIFSNVYARMVSVGFKSGVMDDVMIKVAEQYEQEVDQKITHVVSTLEPTLVAVLSVIVGMILLSVMLPLMGIMSSIG